MHYPGCKRAHKHGAAGNFVNGRLRRNPQVAMARQQLINAHEAHIRALEDAIKHWNPGLLGAMATLQSYKQQLRSTRIKLARVKADK